MKAPNLSMLIVTYFEKHNSVPSYDDGDSGVSYCF